MGRQARERKAKVQLARLMSTKTGKVRLFDKFVGASEVEAVISVDNVETYCFENGKIFETWKDFPMIRPPFDEVFVECAAPKQKLLTDINVRAYGMYMHVLDTEKHNTLMAFREHYSHLYSRVGNGAETLKEFTKQVFRGATQLIYVELVADWFSELGVITSAFIPIDASGAYTKTMILWGGIQYHKRYEHIFNNPEWKSERGYDFTTEYLHTMISVIMMGMSLIHCKNVSLVERVPDAQTCLEFQAATGRGLTKYREIEVRPFGKRDISESHPQQQFNVMPLHIRRGNFATYTAEAPLFGKYIGTFWRPATLVGDEKNGVVGKDYEVTP